ncbi:MAG: hypothetical protein AB7F65_06280 [Dehalococcoidia bacterium]
MVGLGLLPLAALARAFGVAEEHTFLLPTQYALIVGLVIGVAVCGIIGRSVGLLGAQDIGTYAHRHRVESGEAATAARRTRPSRSRIRSTAAAPFVRFS